MRPFQEAPSLYWLIAAGTSGDAPQALPIDLIGLLVIVAVVNGLVAPPFRVVLMVLSEERQLTDGQPVGSLLPGRG